MLYFPLALYPTRRSLPARFAAALPMPTVFVISREWMFRAGLRAELRERGMEALGMETVDDAARAVAQGTMPTLIVWDAADEPPAPADAPPRGLDPLGVLARGVPLVVIASRLLEQPLPQQAVAVLYRPVSIGQVVECVLKILEGQPA